MKDLEVRRIPGYSLRAGYTVCDRNLYPYSTDRVSRKISGGDLYLLIDHSSKRRSREGISRRRYSSRNT